MTNFEKGWKPNLQEEGGSLPGKDYESGIERISKGIIYGGGLRGQQRDV